MLEAPATTEMPAAAFATPRNPNHATDGARIGRIANALGKPLMPWQQHVADVATERDAAGNYVYDLVLVTVPRQSGKTTLLDVVMTDRTMFTRNASIFYTAQTQKDATARFRDLADMVRQSPLAAVAKFKWAQGSTQMELPTGSRLRLFAPTTDALHGETPPFVALDEIFAHSETLGDAMLEGAIWPAQTTLVGRSQVWMISTAGTAESTFMRKWVERGRAGSRPGMAYFEWSLPEGEDPYDPDAIAAFHPGVGHTVSVADLLKLGQSMSRAKWLRGFCNVWTEASDPVIDLDLWDALGTDEQEPPASMRDVTIAYEVDGDGDSAAIVAAWRNAAGKLQLRTVHRAPGTIWLAPLVQTLHDTWKPRRIAADDGGSTRRVTARLLADGLDIDVLSGKAFSTACDQLLAAARDRHLEHDGSDTLRRGIANVVLQRSGDTQRFSRHASTGPVSGPIAAAVAAYSLDYSTAYIPKPVVDF